jgi:hypothetical protein
MFTPEKAFEKGKQTETDCGEDDDDPLATFGNQRPEFGQQSHFGGGDCGSTGDQAGQAVGRDFVSRLPFSVFLSVNEFESPQQIIDCLN